MTPNDYSRYGSHYANGSPYAPRSAARKKTSRRAFVIGGVAVGVVAVAATATPAMAAGTIDDLKAKASEITDAYREIVESLKAGDFLHAQELVRNASESVSAFKKDLDGPLWRVAEFVPVLGSDVKAARSLVGILDGLTSDALIPIVDVLAQTSLDRLFFKNEQGDIQIDLPTVSSIADIVTASLPTIRDALKKIADIGELHIDQLKNAVDQVKEIADPLSKKIDKFGELLGVIPQLLGEDGQSRLYLVVAQNNVEIRCTGGFAGAWCPIHVSNGVVSMGDVTDVYSVIPVNPDYRLAITDEEWYLFGESISYMPGNDGLIPDFPRVCDLWRQFWEYYQWEHVDGIIAVDPIFFQSMVGLTPGIAMDDGTWLDGTSTARVLMHDTYWNYMGDGNAMDEYFAAAASAAVEAIFDNISNIDIIAALKAIQAGMDNYNLLMWLADPEECAVLESFNCTGGFKHDEATPELGIYVSNASWSKIEWWLDEDFQLGAPVKNADGSTSYQAKLVLSNAATWEEINAADAYIVGTNPEKRDRDDILDYLFLYAPAGGRIDNLTIDGDAELEQTYHEGFQLYWGLAHMQIGTPVTVEFTVTTSPRATEELIVRRTPTVQNVR